MITTRSRERCVHLLNRRLRKLSNNRTVFRPDVMGRSKMNMHNVEYVCEMQLQEQNRMLTINLIF
jgi:hypothetical protein